jgi:predicted phosphodiesterase
MRYGIFSDVHSNLEAMTAVAQAMKADGAEEYLCLGDFVGYYSQPNETLDLIESLNCWKAVVGNHDAAAIGRITTENFNGPAIEAIRWTRQHLKPKHAQFLENLKVHESIGEIQLVHSSPFQSEEWHYLTKPEDIETNFRYFQGFICFYGHVHKPSIAEQRPDGTVTMIETPEYTLKKDCRYLVNVGSVGQPRDGSPKTCYVMYDSTAKTLAIRRLDYDYETTARKTLAAGLPEYLAQRLKTGK